MSGSAKIEKASPALQYDAQCNRKPEKITSFSLRNSVTIQVNEERIEKIIQLIWLQTGIGNSYVSEHLAQCRLVTVNLVNAPVDAVLALICVDQPVILQRNGRMIYGWERARQDTLSVLVADEKVRPLPQVIVAGPGGG